ncbi:MAG: sigma factor-like helix-turn-helix DNA-binding protein [Acidimicrobiales bacterium]
MPPGEKDAVVTAFYGECSYRQAAIVLGEPEGTITSQIRAGLRRLAPLIAGAGTVGSDDPRSTDRVLDVRRPGGRPVRQRTWSTR